MYVPRSILLLLGALAAQSAPAHALLITKTNSTFGTFDNGSITRDVIITRDEITTGTGIITKMTVLVDFAKCDEFTTPTPDPGGGCTASGAEYQDQMGTTMGNKQVGGVLLVDFGTYTSAGGATTSGRVTVLFDDAAPTTVGGPMTSGTFAPVGLLSDFVGLNAVGIWTLTLADNAAGAAGGFYRFTLNVETQVPEPGTLALLGLGLVGLGLMRRRRAA